SEASRQRRKGHSATGKPGILVQAPKSHNPGMLEPRFALLDIVTISSGDDSERGRQGVVTQVRRYPDGTHKYTLGWMSDDEMGGLYPEEWLEATGKRSTLEELASTRKFKSREVVRIGPNGPIEIRGKLGHVEDGRLSPSDDQYAVWVDETNEIWMVS